MAALTRGDTSAILAAAAVACESPAWYMSWRSLKDDYLYDIHTHTWKGDGVLQKEMTT